MKNLVTLILAILLSSLVFNAHSNEDETLTQPEQSQVQLLSMSVNINKANANELVTLKGVGEKKAQAIIQYRETYGDFISKEDLLNVQGIGKKIVADNVKRIVL